MGQEAPPASARNTSGFQVLHDSSLRLLISSLGSGLSRLKRHNGSSRLEI